MRKLNISVAKSYTDKNTNAIKTKWITIGSLVIGDDGKVFGEIETIPVGISELKFNCFDKDESKSYQQSQPTHQQQPQHMHQAPHGPVPVYQENVPHNQQHGYPR